jgi:hypothetical protein
MKDEREKDPRDVSRSGRSTVSVRDSQGVRSGCGGPEKKSKIKMKMMIMQKIMSMGKIKIRTERLRLLRQISQTGSVLQAAD